jgi:hypothetical protein
MQQSISALPAPVATRNGSVASVGSSVPWLATYINGLWSFPCTIYSPFTISSRKVLPSSWVICQEHPLCSTSRGIVWRAGR